jgi:hypothetical protein
MSLVNDALRRAKESQEQAAPLPPSQMQFRPVEPGQQVQRGLGLLVPITLGGVALLALILCWEWAQGNQMIEPREVRAVTPIAPQPTATTPSGPGLPTEATPTPPSEPKRSLQTEPGPNGDKSVADTSAVTPSNQRISPQSAKAQEDRDADGSMVASAPQPKPAPLRLQAIVFNPKRPSALVNGKTLFIGDKLGELRVVAIDQESATLVGAGRTNILSLPE